MQLSIQDGLWWGGEVRLPSWAGFQSRRGAHGAPDSRVPSDGSVQLVFAPEGRGVAALAPEEEALVTWFFAHEEEVSRAVVAAILQWCAPDSPARRAQFGDDMRIGAAIPDAAALRRRIGLHTVYIHQIADAGLPYIGFEFGCDWEDEHGLGVLMHGTRTVEVGHADTAFLLWIAEADAEARRE